jgi:hypothetical protein
VTEIVWREPPVPKGQPADLATVAQGLRENPGRSALVRTFPLTEGGVSAAHSMAHNINKGRYKSFRPAGEFTATSATEEDGANVYVTWTGEQA